MQVNTHYRNDPERTLTDPLPEPYGKRFIFRLYSGDICDPQNGNWFKEPYPTRVWRAFIKYPILPFIAWVWPKWIPFIGGKALYAGFKLYGVDSEQYKEWPVGIKEGDVYEGSQALCLTIRPFATI